MASDSLNSTTLQGTSNFSFHLKFVAVGFICSAWVGRWLCRVDETVAFHPDGGGEGRWRTRGLIAPMPPHRKFHIVVNISSFNVQCSITGPGTSTDSALLTNSKVDAPTTGEPLEPFNRRTSSSPFNTGFHPPHPSMSKLPASRPTTIISRIPRIEYS